MSKKQKKAQELSAERDLRAKDVKDATGLSYRQLNDWESKGAVPNERKDKSKWRKFTAREVFVISVCKEIRDKFKVPIESFGFIRSFMLQKEANHFEYSLKMMRMGLCVYLMTDLKDFFVMDTDLEFEDLFRLGIFRGEEHQSYIFIKINPLVNRMLNMKNLSSIKIDEEIYNSLHKFKQQATTQKKQEMELLNLIRSKAYKRVTAHIKGGQIFQVDAEEELGEKLKSQQAKNLLKIVEEKKYQTITVQLHDGKIVRVSRKSTTKL
jgi:hypothetical protein